MPATISVILPVYNEESNIRPIHDGLSRVLRREYPGYEIIFIDDASTDGSARILKEISAADARVRVHRQPRRSGKLAALSAAIGMAEGKFLVNMDSDLQYDPEDIPALVREAEKGAMIVYGRRMRRIDPWQTRASSLSFNWVLRKLTKLDFHDFFTGLKCHQREVFETHGMPAELLRMSAIFGFSRGLAVKEIPIRHYSRHSGKSNYNLFSRLALAWRDLNTVYFSIGIKRRRAGVFSRLRALGFRIQDARLRHRLRNYQVPNLQLQMGITNLCNYRCEMCSQTDEEGLYGADNPNIKGPPIHGGLKGNMSMETFMRATNSMASRTCFDIISLMWIGESLMHPNFFEMIDFLFYTNEKKKFFRTIVLNTNASPLSKKITDRVIEYYQRNIDNHLSLVFSLDAATEETYRKQKRTNLYDRTIQNIQYFIQEKKQKGLINISLYVQFLVMPENTGDINLFKDFWGSYFEKLSMPFGIVSDYSQCRRDCNNFIFYKATTGYNQKRLSDLHATVSDRLKLPIYAGGGL